MARKTDQSFNERAALTAIARYKRYIQEHLVALTPQEAKTIARDLKKPYIPPDWAIHDREALGGKIPKIPADQLLVFFAERDADFPHGPESRHRVDSSTPLSDGLQMLEEDRLQAQIPNYFYPNQLARWAAIVKQDAKALREFPIPNTEATERVIQTFAQPTKPGHIVHPFLHKEVEVPAYIDRAAEIVLVAMRESRMPSMLPTTAYVQRSSGRLP